VSDQGLRTAVLAGRPALGMPDWRVPGAAAAMSAQEIADVVAWLIGHRQEQHDG
jgi:cytochrome c oxidase cbb3-type subunit 3/ubiquinol-cytochrome c reductase cytochrome c subunit